MVVSFCFTFIMSVLILVHHFVFIFVSFVQLRSVVVVMLLSHVDISMSWHFDCCHQCGGEVEYFTDQPVHSLVFIK